MSNFIHLTAEIGEHVIIGENTKIWHYVQIREGAIIGENCILGKGVYIDFDVKIGNNVKIQNNSSIYHGSLIEDGVFIGPHVCLTNDKNPRSTDGEGNLLEEGAWKVGKILLKKGCSIGAGSIILPNVIIGEFALIGAGSVVTKHIPDFALAYGNPAKIFGAVGRKGNIVKRSN